MDNVLSDSIRAAVAERMNRSPDDDFAQAVIECLVTLGTETVHLIWSLASAAKTDPTQLMNHLTHLMQTSLRERMAGETTPITWH